MSGQEHSTGGWDDAREAAPVTCYRHPDREAPIGCSRCGRPICLDDAIDAPVGYLCPECGRQPRGVQRAQRRVSRAAGAPATKGLVGVLVAVYVAELLVQDLWVHGALVGAAIGDGQLVGVAEGEWWRVVTSGFLHDPDSILHVAFNGYLLWMLGQMLEPRIGTSRFLTIYSAGLLGGSAGALALSWAAPTIGASGAVFGLMGAAMVGLRQQGINPWSSGIGTLVLLNLGFTFLVPGISIGGHLGGIVGGALAAVPIFHLGRRHDRRELVLAGAIAAVLGVAAIYAGAAGPLT